MDELIVGKILWFNKAKGFGEIFGEDDTTYFFTHEDIESNKQFKVVEKDDFVYFSPSQDKHKDSQRVRKVKLATKKKVSNLHSQSGISL